MGYEVVKTEHAGAKNGGGFWGTRADAKRQSSKRRRLLDLQAEEEEIDLMLLDEAEEEG